MVVQNNQMIFDEDDKVICCRKDRPYGVGKVKRLGGKHVIQMDKEYLSLSTFFWEYTVPFDKHFKAYLDEHNTEQQYDLIKEQFHGIITNKGRQINAE